MIKFIKTAAQVIDQQQDIDKSILWDIIQPYWPEDLNEPLIGYIEKDANFAVEASHNDLDIEQFYPINSKEASLASSMYFLLDGLTAFDPEDQLKIASRLKKARIQWGVSLPSEFVKMAQDFHTPEVEELVFADDDKKYNISTPTDIMKSASLFESSVSKYSAGDVLKIAMIMNEAALYFDMDIEIPYADIDGDCISDMFVESIEKRASLVEPFFKSTKEDERGTFIGYLEDLDSILDVADNISSKADIIKVAKLLY
jgi:hypothetical protein